MRVVVILSLVSVNSMHQSYSTAVLKPSRQCLILCADLQLVLLVFLQYAGQFSAQAVFGK